MNFNERVEDIPQALSIFINQLVYDKKSRGEKVYTFSLGEASFEVPRFSLSAEAFERGKHYSSSMGQPDLRCKISDMYQSYYNVSIDPNSEVLVSAGSKVLIFMLLQTVLNSRDKVLVPEPAWLSYKEQIKLVNAAPVPIPYNVAISSWDSYVTSKTKMIIINNPNNPSGMLLEQRALKDILDLAVKHDLYILCDEAYSDFLLDNTSFVSLMSLDKLKKHALVVNSLSKNMGLSGWRIGYALANKDVISRLLKINQHIVTCAPTVLQDYLAEHFESILCTTIPQARKIAEKRAEVQKIMERIGIKYLPGEATFYFMIDVRAFKGTTEEFVFELLLNHNIAVVPGRAYGESVSGFIRFGIGVEPLDSIEKCLRIIKELICLSSYDSEHLKIQLSFENIEID